MNLNEKQTIAIQIYEKYNDLKNKQGYISVPHAIQLYESYHHHRLEYFTDIASIFKHHFKLSSIKHNIVGLDALIQKYMSSSINYECKNITNGALEISLLNNQNIYVELPRDDFCKPDSMFYLIKDFVSNLKLLSEHHLYEDFFIYDFGVFKIIGPLSGGTHRTLGLCLAYELLEDQYLNIKRIYEYTGNYKKLVILKTVIEKFVAIDVLDNFKINFEGSKILFSFQKNDSKINIEFDNILESIDFFHENDLDFIFIMFHPNADIMLTSQKLRFYSSLTDNIVLPFERHENRTTFLKNLRLGLRSGSKYLNMTSYFGILSMKKRYASLSVIKYSKTNSMGRSYGRHLAYLEFLKSNDISLLNFVKKLNITGLMESCKRITKFIRKKPSSQTPF